MLPGNDLLNSLNGLPRLARLLIAGRLFLRSAKALAKDAGISSYWATCEILERYCLAAEAVDLQRVATSLENLIQREVHPVLKQVLRELRSLLLQFDPESTGRDRETVECQHVGRILDSLQQEPRFSALQIAILVGSDLEQLQFQCRQYQVEGDQPLGREVMGSLTPCHALTLLEPKRSLEDEFR